MTEVAHLPRLPSAAERMRLYRERRRRGLSCIKVPFEVRWTRSLRIVGTHRPAGSWGLIGSDSSISRCQPNRKTPIVTRNIKMVTRHGPCQRHRAPIGRAGMTAKALKRRRVQAPGAWQALTQAGKSVVQLQRRGEAR